MVPGSVGLVRECVNRQTSSIASTSPSVTIPWSALVKGVSKTGENLGAYAAHDVEDAAPGGFAGQFERTHRYCRVCGCIRSIRALAFPRVPRNRQCEPRDTQSAAHSAARRRTPALLHGRIPFAVARCRKQSRFVGQRLGIALLVGLMGLALYNDLARPAGIASRETATHDKSVTGGDIDPNTHCPRRVPALCRSADCRSGRCIRRQ